jgi:RimJ/RimL family protein N-acetyltransferase
LEVSLALRPLKDGSSSGSGLMSSALRQSCLQVKSWFSDLKEQDLVIYAFVNQNNPASIRVIEAAGFIKKGEMKYDSTSEGKSLVYILSWRKLKRKVKDSLEKALRNKMKVVLEPQITDSHCGPAVVKALLGFNKVNVSQDEVVNAARVNATLAKHGMRPAQIALAVKRLAPEMKFLFKQQTTARDLEKLVHKYKIPVAINWQGLFYGSVAEEKLKSKTNEAGHYSVVIDLNSKEDQVVIDDPYSEYFEIPRVFSYKWFKSRWWDTDELFDIKGHSKNILKTKKLIFIIVPKHMEFPASLGLKGIEDFDDMERLT